MKHSRTPFEGKGGATPCEARWARVRSGRECRGFRVVAGGPGELRGARVTGAPLGGHHV